MIEVEPNPEKGYEFVNAITGGVIPKEYIPSIDKGIQDALKSGVLAGFPVVDVKVTLVFGSYHEVDSSEQAFYVAGSMAIKDAMNKATPALLEPYMDVEVVTPDDYLGDVMGRPQRSSWSRAVHGSPRRRSGCPRSGSAVRNVRLRHGPAFPYAGPRDLHDAVPPLRKGACGYR